MTRQGYIHQKIDVSAESCLGICECGWRALELSKPDVMKLLATHTYRSHPGFTSPGTRRQWGRNLVSSPFGLPLRVDLPGLEPAEWIDDEEEDD